MRMSVNQFCRDSFDDVLKRESPRLLCNGGVHDDMQQNVPKSLCSDHPRFLIDRLHHLICFFDEHVPDGQVGLFPVPRTLLPQPPHDQHKFLNLSQRDALLSAFHSVLVEKVPAT